MRHSAAQRRWALALAVALAGCRLEPLRAPVAGTPRAEPGEVGAELRYLATWRREPGHALEVELELGPGAPREFLFTSAGGVRSVQAVEAGGRVREVAVGEEGEVSLPEESRWLRYRYPVEELTSQWGRSLDSGMGEGGAWLVSGRSWLVRPRWATPEQRVELRVEGVEALLPWVPGPGGVYRLTGMDLVDSGFHGFGGRRCGVAVEGATLEVGILGEMERAGDEVLCAWVRQAAREVLTVRSRFPSSRATVLVVPVPGAQGAGLFGMVLWSTPPSIALLVGQQASPESFAGDWVAVHELMHLAHPTFVPRVMWLSEGLATYLAELGKARSGRQTREQTWEELVEGFARGRDQAGARTLRQVVSAERLYQATYWAGALLALHLDMELRQRSHGQHCLEEVLERLGRSGSTSTLEAFGAEVDEVAGQPLFHALLERHLPRPAFAEQHALLRSLGVLPAAGGVQLTPAPLAHLREVLLTGSCLRAREPGGKNVVKKSL